MSLPTKNEKLCSSVTSEEEEGWALHSQKAGKNSEEEKLQTSSALLNKEPDGAVRNDF